MSEQYWRAILFCYYFRVIYNFVVLQTIKCLLIVPNAESALNEEAGKLLLENYEEYYKRASMMTEIHAQVLKSSPILIFELSIR